MDTKNATEAQARIQRLGERGNIMNAIQILEGYYGEHTEDVLAQSGYYSITRLVGELIDGIHSEADGLYDFYQEAMSPQESREIDYANGALGTQTLQFFIDTLDRVRKDGSPYWNLNTSLERIRPMTVPDCVTLLDTSPQDE